MFTRLGSTAARTAGARPRVVYARSVANARGNHAPTAPTAPGSAKNSGSSVASANTRRITDPQAAPRPVADDTTRGVNSADFFGGPSGTASRLRAGLNAALHPGAGASVDPEAVLAAVRGYVDAGLEVPILHRNSVSSILAKHYASTPVGDTDVVALADVLAAICLDPRALAATTAKSGKNHYAVSARYARWLAAEAGRADGARVRTVLAALERQLAALGARASGGAPLPPAQGAAWAMLRARATPSEPEAGDQPADVSLRLPTYDAVVAQAERLGADPTDAAFVAAATALFRDDAAALPTTVRALEGRLAFLRGHHRLPQVQALWDAFAPLLDAGDTAHGLIRDDGGAAALGAFYTILAPRPNELVADRDALAPYLDAVKARFPSPTPLPILHALLRASRPGELDATIELDPEAPSAAGSSTAPTGATGPRRDRDVVLAAAKTTWDRVRAEGVTPDVQAYRIYLGLLGHHGEWLAMLQLWDDLIANDAARALWQDELRKSAGPEGVSETELNGAYEPIYAVLTTAWPPTVVLNQVLSSAFMIGRRAAEVAMGLFKVAITPESQLAVDVVTVNTVLRWAAHLADVGMINEVISTAGRLKIKPDIITYTTIVHGLLRADRPDLARATLDAMRSRGVEPNDRMASMLVGDLAAEGTADGLRRAEDVIRDMRARGIRTTTPMWTSLVGGYFSGGWQLDGWDALARMRQHGHKLNDKGYNIVLRQVTRGSGPRARGERGGARKGRGQVAQPDALEADGADSPAIRLFRRMVADGVVPNADTYTILLDPLVAARRAREVDEVLADMDRRRFTTLRPALNRMIREARRLTRQRERQR